MMSMEPAACEDLKAFERRLTEVIADLAPSTLRWRIVLFISMVFTFFAGFRWVYDPRTTSSMISLTASFLNHPLFIMGFIVLVVEFAFGVHKLVVAPHIITNRTRSVLSDFNMSCDDSGKLILKPRPTNMGNPQQQQQQQQQSVQSRHNN